MPFLLNLIIKMISQSKLSYIESILILFVFATFLPNIYPSDGESNGIKALDQIFSTKKASDSIITKDGNIGSAHLHYIKVSQASHIQMVAIQERLYSSSLGSVVAYRNITENQCQDHLQAGEIKTCIITKDDEVKSIPGIPPQHTEVEDGGAKESSSNLLPNSAFQFTAAGDFRENTGTDENMAANSPDIVLILGDFSYNGNAERWWSENMYALNNLNVIAALGNNDDPNDDFLNLWPLNEGKWEFIYKVSNVAFVAFNTEENDPDTIDPLLAQAQADPSVDHIIPFSHKTVFTPTPGKPLKPDADREYFYVFKKYDKIRMILGGHNHFYARMNAVPETDFIYVTVGNGGANPHQDSGESGSPPKQYVESNGALHCSVNDHKISCKMISNEGKVWDDFTITPGNPPASDQDPSPVEE